MYIYWRNGYTVTKVKVTMTDKLKQINRTLLELLTGLAVFAVTCQVAVLFVSIDQMKFLIGFWTGIALAVFSGFHMLRSLNRAFDCDEKAAARVMAGGYLLRYLVIGTLLVLLYLTDKGYPLACFLGVLGLKAGAYLQPLTHKFFNRLFHETDPIPQPLCEENEKVSETEQM